MTKLLTKSETASVLNVSERTVNRWVAAKKLKAVRIGNVFRVHPEDIEKFIRRNAA